MELLVCGLILVALGGIVIRGFQLSLVAKEYYAVERTKLDGSKGYVATNGDYFFDGDRPGMYESSAKEYNNIGGAYDAVARANSQVIKSSKRL